MNSSLFLYVKNTECSIKELKIAIVHGSLLLIMQN